MLVKTEGPPNARIFLVGEAPGADENLLGRPFVSHAGKVLDSLLSYAGINRLDCLVGNVAREQPPGNKIEFFFEDSKCTKPKTLMLKYVNMLQQEIIQYNPNIVVGLGATALWALTGMRGIQSFRGYVQECTLVPGKKVLCTYHPAAVSRDWSLQFPAVMDLRKALRNSDTPDIPKDTRALRCNPSKREFIQYLQWLTFDWKDPIALDIETKANCHIDILGLAHSPNNAISFEILSGGRPKYEPREELEIWYWLSRALEVRPSIMHNGLFDACVLWLRNRVLTKTIFADTLIGAHVCWPEHPRSLGFLSSICLNVPAWKHQQTLTPTLYNAADAANTYGVWEVLSEELDRQKIRHTFDFEMSQVFPAGMLQLQGISVDKESQNDLLNSPKQDDLGRVIGIRPRLSLLTNEINRILNKNVNLNSPKQLQQVLYTDLGLPEQYRRRASINDPRKVTADSEALQKLSKINDNPALTMILEWKKLDKLQQFVDVTTSPEGKVHTSYNITGATMQREAKGLVVDDENDYRSFGRWSSSKSIILPFGSGNLQNVPRAARKIYRSPTGYSFISADYIQAEAVVVAYIINDLQLIRMFEDSFGKSRQYRKENNLDVHRITASQLFGIPIDKVTPDQRQVGKTLRHANNYSAGPGVLAAKLGIGMKEAKYLMNLYHQRNPMLRIWHQKVQNELRSTKILYNLLGRKHQFTERWSDELFRSAYSYIPQSTVGDLLNMSLVKIYNNYGDRIDIALQLHDAVYVIVPDHLISWAMQVMRECMLHPLQVNGMDFKIDIDFSIGPSWGEMEEVEYTDYVKSNLPVLPN